MSSEDKYAANDVTKFPDLPETHGYDCFPEREGRNEKTFLQKMIAGRKNIYPLKCIGNAYWCIKNDYFVRLMVGALRSQGCPIDITRHISCEDCTAKVNGGYDPVNNQVVICQNNSRSRRVACSVLSHELIHMFDFCRAKVDFKNLEHLACTEIRAANFMHCAYLTAVADNDASFFNSVDRHRVCVRRKAVMSILMVRNVDMEKAERVVDKVFEKCYKDLEPFGRIPRRNSRDPERILAEAYMFGYSDVKR